MTMFSSPRRAFKRTMTRCFFTYSLTMTIRRSSSRVAIGRTTLSSGTTPHKALTRNSAWLIFPMENSHPQPDTKKNFPVQSLTLQYHYSNMTRAFTTLKLWVRRNSRLVKLACSGTNLNIAGCHKIQQHIRIHQAFG